MIDWNLLGYTCQFCQKCVLADTRRQVIFGAGNPKAKVVFVGASPGPHEDLTGTTFAAEEGLMFNTLLSILDLDRSTNIYLTYLVKCYPPQNRNPLTTEQRSCFPFLQQQLAYIQPKIVLCFGEPVAQILIHEDFDMDQEHGIFYEKDGMEFMGLYDLKTLLQDPTRKPLTFDDIIKLERRIQEIAPETYAHLHEKDEVNWVSPPSL